MTSRLAVTGYVLACFVALGSHVAHAQTKTDVVVLLNGDRVTCEVEELTRGRLTVSTDSIGTVRIEWDDVRQITSTAQFEVEVDTGERFIGSLEPGTPGQLVVVSDDATTSVVLDSVVGINQIGKSFAGRIDAAVTLGVSFTKANKSKQWNFNAEATHRATRLETSATVDAYFSQQEGLDAASRQKGALQFRWFLPQRWFAATVTEGERNEEIDLARRSLIGGGVGRYLVQSNRTVLSTIGGLVWNGERFSGAEATEHHAEAFGVIQFQKFTFDDPEIDTLATLAVLPSLSQAGRVRAEFSVRVRREILSDLYFNISFFDSFDSDSPATDRSTHDYGLTSSIGWSF